MSSFSVVPLKKGAKELTKYEKVGDAFDVLGGRMWYATTGPEDKKIEVLVKELDKSVEWAERAYKNEQECYRKVRMGSVSKILSFFEDEQHYYAVYARPLGERLMTAMDEQKAKPFCIQMMRFIDQLHKKGVLYLREEADNLWVTEEGRLTVVGLDFGQIMDGNEASVSKFAVWDEVAEDITDDYALAVAIHRILNGPDAKLFEGDSRTPKTVGVHQKLIKQLCDEMVNRDDFNYHKKKYLITPVEIKVDSENKRVNMNDFYITWDGGIGFGYKQAELGLSIEEFAVYVKSGDAKISLGLEGLKFEDTEKNQDLTLGPDGLVLGYGEDGPYRQTVTVNLDGLNCSASYLGEFGVNEQGFHYQNGGKQLVLGENFAISGINPFSDLKLKFKPLTVTIGTLQVTIDNGVMLSVMDTGIVVNAAGLTIKAGETKLNIGKAGLTIDIGSVVITINGAGFTIEMGEALCTINGQGLVFDCNGFLVTLNGSGAKCENSNGPIDLKGNGVDLPPIKLDVPGIDKFLPKGLPSFKKKSKKPAGEIADHMEENEECKFESLIVAKKVKGIGTNKMHAVVTNHNRIIFLNSTYYERRRDDLQVVEGMKLSNPNGKTLNIENPETGEVRTLKFKKKGHCAEFTMLLGRFLNKLERTTKRKAAKAAKLAEAPAKEEAPKADEPKEEEKQADTVAEVAEEEKQADVAEEKKEDSEKSSSESEDSSSSDSEE